MLQLHCRPLSADGEQTEFTSVCAVLAADRWMLEFVHLLLDPADGVAAQLLFVTAASPYGIDGCRHLCALLCKLCRRERCEADPCNAALGGGHLTVCQLALKMPKQRRAGRS